jgi:hypothetical protein
VVIIFFLTQFSLADSLYTHGYYNLSRIEYKREFFFYPELKKDQYKRLKFAVSLLHHDKYEGLQEFDNMNNDYPDLKSDIKSEMARYCINLGNYYRAEELLNQIDEKNLLGYTYLLDNKYNHARNLFIASGDYELAKKIDEFINRPKKSLMTATLLSFVCPGSGEIYAGNINSGIRGFLLNLASGYLLYHTIKQKKYIDAVLVFNLLFNRFYIGSIYNAQKSVIETNGKQKGEWLEDIKNNYFQDLDLDPQGVD